MRTVLDQNRTPRMTSPATPPQSAIPPTPLTRGGAPRETARPKKCRILIILTRKALHAPDFERIGQYIGELDDRVQLRVVRDVPHTWLRPCVWSRPTFAVALGRVSWFHPMRGSLCQCWPLGKIGEYRRLEAAGLPVAPWTILREGEAPDLSCFGPVVVVKPAHGARGTDVRLMRTEEVRYEPPNHRAARFSRDLIVQRLIHTGPWPSYYRVTTFFGQTLLANLRQTDPSRPPVPHPNELRDRKTSFEATAVYPYRDTRRISLVNNAEVIALAEQAHQTAFSDIPLLGVDIMREQETGKLFISEVNSAGGTWAFSTPTGQMTQQKFGFRYEAQFDGFRKAARILLEQARRHAH